MEASFFQKLTFTCPQCDIVFQAEVCLIVDAIARPDLLERIRDDTIHTIICPAGHATQLDAPLLLYRSKTKIPIIFVPANQSTLAMDLEQTVRLIQELRQSLGEEWQDAWVSVPIPHVQRSLLPALLSASDQDILHLIEEAARRPEALGWLLVQFGHLRSREELYQALTHYPELLSDEAQLILNSFITDANAQNDQEAGIFLNELRDILQFSKEIGVEAAITAKMSQQPTKTEDDQLEVPEEFRTLLERAEHGIQQYLSTHDEMALEDSVSAWQEILSHTSFSTAPEAFRRLVLNDAGATFLNRYLKTRDLDDLNRAIDLWQELVALASSNLSAGHRYLANLGIALNHRYEHANQVKDLEMAVRLLREALKRTPAASHDRELTFFKLGNALFNWYGHTWQLEDLNEAVSCFHESMKLTPTGSPEWPGRMNSFGFILGMRFSRTGGLEDLESSIRAWQSVVEKTPLSSPDLPLYLMNLGTGLKTRFGLSNNIQDLEQATNYLKRALLLLPADSSDRTQYLLNLGNIFRTWYYHSKQRDYLEQSIHITEEALGYVHDDPISRSNCLTNLGASFSARFDLTQDPQDLNRGIEAFQEAVALTPENTYVQPSLHENIASSLHVRYEHSSDIKDMHMAIRHFEHACRLGMDLNLDVALSGGYHWGNWAMERSAWSEATQAYEYAVQAFEQMEQMQLLRASQEEILGAARGLHARTAYALAREGRTSAAVVTLERGRARNLNATLERDRANLDQLEHDYPELYNRYRQAARQLRQFEAFERIEPWSLGTGTSAAPADQMVMSREIRSHLSEIVRAIQAIEGYESFLAIPTIADIRSAVDLNCPLVYLATTHAGGFALIVYQTNQEADLDIKTVWLDAFTDKYLRERLSGSEDDYPQQSWFGAYYSRHSNLYNWEHTIEQITRELWNLVMAPLLDQLVLIGAERAIFIPSGLVSLLPLHAAWTEQDNRRIYALDKIILSYIPSARVLTQARGLAIQGLPDRLLAVDDPYTGRAGQLIGAQVEVDAVTSFFEAFTHLRDVQATQRAVLAALPEAHIVHFACHGSTNWNEASQSNLSLANRETLTVRDILGLNLLGPRIAILSACETGIIGNRLPDEVVSLPSAFLQAGFMGITASLWSVPDMSTAMLMERFYRLWRVENVERSDALRQAQRWVRDTTNGEKKAYYERFFSEPASSAKSDHMTPPEVAKKFYEIVEWEENDERSFAHPLWWAAFTYTGV